MWSRRWDTYGAPEFVPGFQCGSCCSIFSFLCDVLQVVVSPFVRFLLSIILSVLLRFTLSDYPFGIFKLFLIIWLSNISILSVPDKGYSRNTSCAQNLISTFSCFFYIIVIRPVICVSALTWCIIYIWFPYLRHMWHQLTAQTRWLSCSQRPLYYLSFQSSDCGPYEVCSENTAWSLMQISTYLLKQLFYLTSRQGPESQYTNDDPIIYYVSSSTSTHIYVSLTHLSMIKEI